MPSNHFILCHPLLFLPSIFPSIRVFSSEWVLSSRWPKYWSFTFSIRVFSNESALLIRWVNYWSFSFSISPSSENSGLKPDQNIHMLYSSPINEMYIDQILIRKKVDWLYWIILLNHYKKSAEWFSGKNKSQMGLIHFWKFRTDFFRIDCLDLLAIQGTLKGLLQHHSSKHQFFRFLYSPAVISIYDYWKNHSFD